MKVPFVDLRTQHRELQDELKAAVCEVLESGMFVLGPKVEKFEAAIAELVGVKHAFGVSSGTDALLLSLMALGIGAGDRVITTPFSFFATASTVSRVGAIPVFADVDPKTYNLCPNALAAAIENETRNGHTVKAMIPVHLYGQCAEMDAILALGQEHGIPVIEDAAQAIGSTYSSRGGDRHAGTLGACGCFSFFPTKNLGGIGDSGMVVTGDDELAKRLGSLRVHGSERRYYHGEIGGNFRMDPIQAVALQVKLPHLERWNAKRRENASYYDQELKSLDLMTPTLSGPRENHSYHQYVTSIPHDRDHLASHLQDREIQTAVYYPVPLHLQKCFSDLGYQEGSLPNAEYAAEHTLALPIHPDLTPDMREHVAKSIQSFFR